MTTEYQPVEVMQIPVVKKTSPRYFKSLPFCFDHTGHDLVTGVLIILIVFTIKLWTEHTFIGEEFDLWAYKICQNGLHRTLDTANIPVVIDIGDIKVQPWERNGESSSATPREPLKNLLRFIAKQKPLAIGVDIDFSPDDTGQFIHPDDPEFFNFCLDLWESTQTPIILGVFRHRDDTPSEWLGDIRYESLAGCTAINTTTNPRWLAQWFETPPNKQRLPSMSAALANWQRKGPKRTDSEVSVEPHDLPRWLRWACESKRILPEASRSNDVGEFLVDYSSLEFLQDPRTRIRASTAAELNPFKSRFSDAVVLLGHGKWMETPDVWVVPGEKRPTPGVFIHACGIYTLLTGPLYELTISGRIIADLILSCTILIIILLVKAYYRHHAPNQPIADHLLHLVLTWTAVIFVAILGMIFVHLTRLLWDDFLLVIVALMLHSRVDRTVKWLFATARNQFHYHILLRHPQQH